MPRDWSELFIVSSSPTAGADPVGGAAQPARSDTPAHAADDPPPATGETGTASERVGPQRGGVWRRLRDSLSKTREALGAELHSTLVADFDDAQSWERLEEALIIADVGASTTAAVVAELESHARAEQLSGPAVIERLIELLARTASLPEAQSGIDVSAHPTVILMAGVNGTGKTTTIGKLAWHLQRELHRRVLMVAADTFRAAAREQLESWAQRAGCEIVVGPDGADPGAVVFEAMAAARTQAADVVIVDTAGRLHTQDDLMDELAKIRRVIERQIPGAPHETLLTVDATTGQNGLRQAKLFAATAAVTGIVLTKLDGTARGGIALAIAHELGIPVKLIGVGEALEDLRPFDAEEYARALLA
ncbi:MAG TPA: signal recognition particle-docking protein FtsY [Solirubrobacteraceae bacterium]|nr:signal recognition particle-docking protein FtsY [Solirubrobacteraceae bacterium]